MKILISSCLLGENVRYDGENSSIIYNPKLTFSQKENFMDILSENEIFSFCSEVTGGLNTPRLPNEIKSFKKPFKVINKNNEDTTINFLLGAKKCLDLCNQENIILALLKSKSPSCGSKEIYDGNFNNKLIKGQGLTAKLLMENNIKIFDENNLEDFFNYVKNYRNK